jgi:Uma2 family endonuclease
MSTLTLASFSSATISLDHYEHMVKRGAFAPPFDLPVELMRGRIVEKGTGLPAKFTLEQYEHMVAVGAFDPPFDIAVELLLGEIVTMGPIGEPHSQVIIALNEWSHEFLDRRRFMIRVQMPIRFPTLQSEPEPDLVWVARTVSRDRPPGPDQVALLIEVAGSSLAYDREVKLPIYAMAGIPDCWIVNLIDEQIEVYRKPSGRTYAEGSIYRGDDTLQPLAQSRATIKPSQLFH